MAARRLTKEVKDITTDQTSRSSLTEPQPFILSPSEEDIFLWNVTFNAPELDRENKPHPYAGGVFHGKYVVPQTYPFQPPKFNLVSPIYHPAVTKWGSICCCNIEQLSVQWSPAVTLAKLSTLIYEHLFFKYDSCYCGDDALITLAGKNKKLYEAKAREWITVHFKGIFLFLFLFLFLFPLLFLFIIIIEIGIEFFFLFSLLLKQKVHGLLSFIICILMSINKLLK